MRLVLHLDPSAIEFGETNAGGPYPYLIDVGELRLAARAGEAVGIAGTESASVTVRLDNRGRRAATIIGRPLRVAADIYDDDNNLFASGTVSEITYGDEITLEVAS
jgi:hypothetical protein